MQHCEIIIRRQCSILFITWTGKYAKTKCHSLRLVYLSRVPRFVSGWNTRRPNCCAHGDWRLSFHHRPFQGFIRVSGFYSLYFSSFFLVVSSLAFLKYFKVPYWYQMTVSPRACTYVDFPLSDVNGSSISNFSIYRLHSISVGLLTNDFYNMCWCNWFTVGSPRHEMLLM